MKTYQELKSYYLNAKEELLSAVSEYENSGREIDVTNPHISSLCREKFRAEEKLIQSFHQSTKHDSTYNSEDFIEKEGVRAQLLERALSYEPNKGANQ